MQDRPRFWPPPSRPAAQPKPGQALKQFPPGNRPSTPTHLNTVVSNVGGWNAVTLASVLSSEMAWTTSSTLTSALVFSAVVDLEPFLSAFFFHSPKSSVAIICGGGGRRAMGAALTWRRVANDLPTAELRNDEAGATPAKAAIRLMVRRGMAPAAERVAGEEVWNEAGGKPNSREQGDVPSSGRARRQPPPTIRAGCRGSERKGWRFHW